MPSLESDFCTVEEAESAACGFGFGYDHPEKSCLSSPALKASAYPDVLATGRVHVGEGGAQGLLKELLESGCIDTGPDDCDVTLGEDGLRVRLDVLGGDMVARGSEDGVAKSRAEGEGVCSLEGTGGRVGSCGGALGFAGRANQLVEFIASELGRGQERGEDVDKERSVQRV